MQLGLHPDLIDGLLNEGVEDGERDFPNESVKQQNVFLSDWLSSGYCLNEQTKLFFMTLLQNNCFPVVLIDIEPKIVDVLN